MQIPMEEFQRRMKALYERDPSRNTPFAFWKMQKMTAEGEGFYESDGDCLYAIRGKELLFYHAGDERRFHIPLERLQALEFMALPYAEFVRLRSKLSGFKEGTSWVLYYDFDHPTAPMSPEYEAVMVDFTTDEHLAQAANVINAGNGRELDFDIDEVPAGSFSPARLRRWTLSKAFDLSLWVLIREKATGLYVGCIINFHHAEMGEVDLDWVYVKPSHHGRGIGRMMIGETVRRAGDCVRVIRVSGMADEFYTKCGFYEKERWGFLVKPGFSMNEQ